MKCITKGIIGIIHVWWGVLGKEGAKDGFHEEKEEKNSNHTDTNIEDMAFFYFHSIIRTRYV